MHIKNVLLTLCTAVTLYAASPAFAQENSDTTALLKALPDATITLQQGLDASESRGNPISAKFELDDGKLQLSVYTAKGSKYWEVVVDYSTGKLIKVTAINGGDDLTQAKAQARTLAKAKSTLKAATDKAIRDNPGFRAISVMPSLVQKHAVAQLVLAKGADAKTIQEALD